MNIHDIFRDKKSLSEEPVFYSIQERKEIYHYYQVLIRLKILEGLPSQIAVLTYFQNFQTLRSLANFSIR